MSLVTCPDCSHRMSHLATACPGCGRPAASIPSKSAQRASAAVAERPGASDWVRPARSAPEPAPEAIAAEADADIRRFAGDPEQARARRRLQVRRLKINIAILVVLIGAGAAVAAWAYHRDQVKKAEAEAIAKKEKEDAELADSLALYNAGAKLQAVTERLTALKQPIKMTYIGVKRQFGVDSDTGLAEFEATSIASGPFVILADPSKLKTMGGFQDLSLAKVGHNAVTVTHTATLTGAQTESTEYVDYYELVTPERIAGLERQAAELKKQVDELNQVLK